MRLWEGISLPFDGERNLARTENMGRWKLWMVTVSFLLFFSFFFFFSPWFGSRCGSAWCLLRCVECCVYSRIRMSEYECLNFHESGDGDGDVHGPSLVWPPNAESSRGARRRRRTFFPISHPSNQPASSGPQFPSSPHAPIRYIRGSMCRDHILTRESSMRVPGAAV